MTPLLVTALIAVAAAAATYGALSLPRRGADHLIADPEGTGSGSAAPPAHMLGGLVALMSLAIAALTLGALAQGVERQTVLVRWDEWIEEWASASAGTVGTEILRAITHLGDTVVVLGVSGLALVVLLSRGRHRLAAFILTVVLGQWALANLIKELVGRSRPELDPLAAFSGYSFPSGHSTAAAATYLALAVVVVAVRPGRDARPLLAGGVGVAVAVAASRALLGVHWFSDVLGGLVLGWAWCLVSIWAMRLTQVTKAPPTTEGGFATANPPS